MFRKLKTLLIAGFSTLALCAGTGLSYWIFTETSSRSIMSGAEVEDLYENYNAGKPVPIQQYEMYLFPSTWYLSQYNDSNNLPEEKYGYINRVLEDDGKTITDTYVIKNQAGVLETMSSVPEYSINSYCKDVDTYDAEGTTDYKTFKLPTNSEPQFDKSILNFNLKDGYKVPTGDKGFNDVGSFAKDLNDTTGVIPTQDNDGIFQETESTDHSGTAGKPIYQELNVDDRLGYWYELEANEGRYLPIKISFSGSISPEVFLKLVSNPRCDMGDANGWHNYAFANWFYYDPELKTNNNGKPYKEPTDGFGNYDRTNLFDVLNNLEDISVEDKEIGKRVIRLFAGFNNGKDYPKTFQSKEDINLFDPDFQGNGYRDGLKVEYKTKIVGDDQKSYYKYQSRYFTFQKGDQNIEYKINGNSNNNYNIAFINNFNTDGKSLEYIDFAGECAYVKRTKSGIFNPTYTYEIKYGDWSNEKTNPNRVTFYPNSENDPSGTNKIKETFQSGDKNIYAITNNTEYTDKDEAISEITNLVNAMKKGDYNSYEGLFGSIKKKELSAINNVDGNNIMVVAYKTGDSWGTPDYVFRAYALFYERILDLKMITGYPVESTPTLVDGKEVYKEKTEGALNKFYEEEFDASRNFYIENNYFYKGSRENEDSKVFIPEGDSINTKIPFIYKMNTLDISKTDLRFFNIRIEKYDSNLSNNIEFNLSPLENGKILFENSDGELTGNGAINVDESNVFVNASEYVEPITVRGVPHDSTEGTYRDSKAFKLKGDETTTALAYYSFILIYNPTTEKPFNFDVYVHKQKNLFVKVFNEEPSAYTSGNKKGFLNHEPEGVKYYKRTYDYNEKILSTNVFKSENRAEQEAKTLDEIFIEFAMIRHDSTDSSGTFKDTSGENDLETYYIVDHVSKTILAKATYNELAKGKFDIIVNEKLDLTVLKNYVLYVITDVTYRSDRYNPLAA